MDALEGLPPPAPILNGGPGIVSLPEDFAAALVSSASAVLSSAASSSIALATPSAIAWSSAAAMEGAAVTTGVAGSTKDSLLKSIAMELPSPDVDAESCQLLGPFALLIQALMGVIVLGSLLVKRQRERPRRKLRIWTADVSKQVIGQLFVHFLNLFISSSIASLPAGGNPCALYFINILVDTTVGVFLVYLSLRLVTHILSVTLGLPLSSLGLLSGLYPSPFLRSWARQLGVYLSALALMKLAVVFLFLVGGDALVKLGDGIIEAISADPKVQVLVAVMIGPVILNVLQFLLIDSFIKGKGEGLPPELLETDDEGGDEEARHGFLGGHESDEEDEDGEDGKAGGHRRKSFHDRRTEHNGTATSNGHAPKTSNWFGKLPPGTTTTASATDGPHSYPPTTSSSSRPFSSTSPGDEKRPSSSTSPRSGGSGSPADLAGEGEGWDDEAWDDWNDDHHGHDDGPATVVVGATGHRSPTPVSTVLPPTGEGSPGGGVVRQVHPPPWQPLGGGNGLGLGEKGEEDDFPIGSPGTPRIVVTEAF